MTTAVSKWNASSSGARGAFLIGACVASFGAALVAAWMLGPGWRDTLAIMMKANASAAVALLGASLCIGRGRWPGRAFAILAALIGAATLLEYAAGVDLRIDELIAPDARNAESMEHPGRMAPNAALSFLLTGAAVALMPRAKGALRYACSAALGVVLVFSLIADVGYLYGAPSLYKFGTAIRISVYTATSLVLVCAAAFTAWPEGTFAALFFRRTAGGVIVRRLLLPVVAAPVALGWVRNLLEVRGFFDDRVGTAVLAVSLILVLGVITWALAREIDRADAAQREALRVRDEFIGLASHELRTPLTSLRLLLQLEQKRPPSPENRAVVMRQVDRLTRLVATMLDTTRLAVGTLAIERQPVDFARVVREAVERVAEKPEQLSVDAPAELQLHGDPLRLGQLVDNLVGNALRYGAGKPVHLRLTQQGAAATLSVRDQGIGFAVADGERIFGPFERAAPSTGYGGLGLGLYLAREIVRAHGGTIHATGAPGAGAEFVVSLPLA